MSSASGNEFEKLQKRRTELENEIIVIEEEQKAEEEEIKVLREKVAIQELRESVRRRQEELSGLRLEKKTLEGQTKDRW